MRFVFNYPVKVAVLTPEGNLAQLRFGVGEVVYTTSSPYGECLFADHRRAMNLELTSGYVLMNVPVGAVRMEPSVASGRV